MSDVAPKREIFVKRFLKNFWSSRRPVWLGLRILLLLILGFVAFVMLFEDSFIYFPSKYPEGDWDVVNIPAREGEISPRVEDVWVKTVDGVRIHGWYCSPQQKSGGQVSQLPTAMTLLWFHGNAGNITGRYPIVSKLMEQRLNVFIIDYRGYGRSEGSPSEQGLYKDADAAWNYLTTERKVSPGNIVIFGDSLGGAVAIDLAMRIEPAGLIVQSSFTSISDMAGEVMPFVPRFILRTKMDSINKIGRVRCPKLFIHSPTDEMVPYKFGRRLFDAAQEPKQFYDVAGASHNETDTVGGRAYFETIGNFARASGAGARA